MKFIFVHGGPGLSDYLEKFFGKDFPDNGIFYTQNSNIETIEDALSELNSKSVTLDEFIFVGHSWGGTLSLEYIKRNLNPQPKALILISSPISYHCNLAFVEHMKELNLVNPTPYEIFFSNLEKNHSNSRSYLDEILSKYNVETFNKIDKNYLQSFDSQAVLKEISIPTMIIFGSEDHRLPTSFQKKYTDLNSNLVVCEVQEAGHFPFFEMAHKDEIVKNIYSFSKTTKNPTSS